MKPRPYQTRTIDECRRLVASGKRAPLIVCPTGGGKTFMGGMIAESVVKKGGRFVWLCHRRELVRQAADTFRNVFALDVGCNGLGLSLPIQVCMVQTLTRREEAPEGTVIGFDEAHHFAAANDWSRLVDAYKDAIRFGFTATPERADGQGLGHAFDSIVVAAQISELIAINRLDSSSGLVPCEVVSPKSTIRSGAIAQRPVDAYQRHAPGTSAVVFAPRIADGQDFVRDFRAAGVTAEMISGDMPGDLRDDALARFASGAVMVVVNVGVLTEGWDCPRAQTCILARKVGSAGLYLQMIGRVLRSFPGKRSALLIDLGGSVDNFGPPDEDRDFNLDGLGITRKGAPAGDRFCQVCGTLIEGDGPCECGEAREAVKVEIAGVEIGKWDRMRALPQDKRAASLARWMIAAREKGHKDGAVKYKFKAVFGHWPDAGIWARATAMREGAR